MDETPTQDNQLPADNQASILMNLESMIKTHLASLETAQEELSKEKGLLDDIFANDETYQKHSEEAKAAIKVRSQTKQQLLKMPQAADLSAKVKSLRSQIAETKGALSDYLREFQRLSGLDEIEGPNGQLQRIVYTAKLVKAT